MEQNVYVCPQGWGVIYCQIPCKSMVIYEGGGGMTLIGALHISSSYIIKTRLHHVLCCRVLHYSIKHMYNCCSMCNYQLIMLKGNELHMD